MKNLSITKKIFFITLSLNVAVFGVYGFLFWNVRTENKEASQLQSEADTDIEKNNELSTVKESLSQNASFISQIDSFFVAHDGVVDFISMLEKLGQDAGVKLNIGSVAVDSTQTKKVDFKEGLRLRIETGGSWRDTLYFLSVVENLPYRVEFNSSSLSLIGAEDSILFKDSSASRERSKDETWKSSFDITVLKLK
jgi:hypothetical protein